MTGPEYGRPVLQSRRPDKMRVAVLQAKLAQAAGKRVVWYTFDQTSMAELLSKHGALCVIEGDSYVVPYFRKSALQRVLDGRRK